MGNAVESKKRNQVKLDFFKSSQMNGRKGNILSFSFVATLHN